MAIGLGSGEEQEVVGDSAAEVLLISFLTEFRTNRNGILLRKKRRAGALSQYITEVSGGTRSYSDLDE